MHVFKLSVTAGPSAAGFDEGTQTHAVCLVDDPEVTRARDRSLLELERFGWASCTFLDVARLPSSPNLAAMSEPMREAYQEARRSGACLIVYPPVPAP